MGSPAFPDTTILEIRPRKRLKYAGDGGNSGGLLSFTSAHTRSQLINSIDILRARRATGLMTRDNYRTVNNITPGKYPEAK